MPKIAVIGGSGFDSRAFLRGFKQEIVKTMYGNVLLFVKGKVIFLPRHGKNKTIPPHKINHKANLCALNLLGAEKIFGICSTGSLKEAIKPGTVVIPDDYVDFFPDSFIEFEMKCVTPELNKEMRERLKAAAKKAKLKAKNKAVYVQAKGPRYETKAEISIIKKWGDIIGMSLAREATLARELAIPYAALCTVDNYANGIAKGKISQSAVEKAANKNFKKALKVIMEIIKKNR
ncbi:6-oxopurine nucleoside phosphorylase [Candidatus Woesearchaeota archaeon]|nr:6-oxopurine nucleoside phosphorylase [Candidatus Woesearchaeota archaeon]